MCAALCRCFAGFPAVCLRGGNCNDASLCGSRYLNANNTASDANWNIGGSLSYPFTGRLVSQQCGHIRVCNITHGRKSAHPQRLLKINLTRGAASK